MIEDIDGVAIIVKAPQVPFVGTRFYTPESSSLQVGRVCRGAGEVIKSHLHIPILRNSNATMEVFYVAKGLVRVEIRDTGGKFIAYRHLEIGDIYIQVAGGHGFAFETDAELIEVKQGPYNPDDKVPL